MTWLSTKFYITYEWLQFNTHKSNFECIVSSVDLIFTLILIDKLFRHLVVDRVLSMLPKQTSVVNDHHYNKQTIPNDSPSIYFRIDDDRISFCDYAAHFVKTYSLQFTQIIFFGTLQHFYHIVVGQFDFASFDFTGVDKLQYQFHNGYINITDRDFVGYGFKNLWKNCTSSCCWKIEKKFDFIFWLWLGVGLWSASIAILKTFKKLFHFLNVSG